jgi:hypothetical protein
MVAWRLLSSSFCSITCSVKGSTGYELSSYHSWTFSYLPPACTDSSWLLFFSCLTGSSSTTMLTDRIEEKLSISA